MTTNHCLTGDERRLTLLLAEAWNAFMSLPIEHPMDRHEFCRDIHQLQDKVLSRAGRRQINAIEQVAQTPVAWQKAVLREEEHGWVIVGWEPCTESEAKRLMHPTRALYACAAPAAERIAEKERDAIAELNHAQWLALGQAAVLIAACHRLSAESEEFEFDDGLGRGILQAYWDEFDSALERATEALDAADEEAQRLHAGKPPVAAQRVPLTHQEAQENPLQEDPFTQGYALGLAHRASQNSDTEMLDWLAEQLVDTIYLDDGRIIDVGTGRIGQTDVRISPHDLRAAIAAARASGEERS